MTTSIGMAVRSSTPDAMSWFGARPAMSLELIGALATPPDAGVVHVGGVRHDWSTDLLERDVSDLTVVDASAVPSTRHVGDGSMRVVAATGHPDLQPSRRWRLAVAS